MVLMNQHHSHNMNDLLHYLYLVILYQLKKKNRNLPDDDPSCGKIILADGVILVVSESVSIQERIAATVELGTDFILGSLFILVSSRIVGAVSRVGVRRRKLTRFRND
jgi:hydrogenase maturation factor HypE